jgi:4-hydroxy 2-oxovalerate aldolase
MKILDCTLRDGGYYTDWHFDQKVVENYFHAMELSGIDIVEVGLRSPQKDKFLGPFTYCNDTFLKNLNLPKSCQIAVMINAKEYILDGNANTALINTQFNSKKDSPVELVRIAAHYSEIGAIPGIFQQLTKLGYEVAVNLMQTGNKTSEEITAGVKILNNLDMVALYFADSFGDMNYQKITSTIETIKKDWKGEIGIHAHNNMGMALNNTMISFDHGVTYLDSTIMGMGRGAGNTQTEYLILEMAKRFSKYSPSAIFPIVLKDFQILQNEYKWGTNLLYYLSSEFNIHPTYIQEILGSNQSTTNILTALENLKSVNAVSYSKDKLSSAFELNYTDSVGTWSPKSLIENKDVLIIGSGPNVKKYSKAIEDYIMEKKPFVISLNLTEDINTSLIDVFASCHPIKLLSDIKKYKDTDKPLMIPYNSLSNNLKDQVSGVNILDYGITIKENLFNFADKTCYLPSPLVFAYTLAAATSAKANRVLVTGLDGYTPGDERQVEMENVLKCYFQNENALKVISVTPTTYNLDQTTIFNYDL